MLTDNAHINAKIDPDYGAMPTKVDRPPAEKSVVTEMRRGRHRFVGMGAGADIVGSRARVLCGNRPFRRENAQKQTIGGDARRKPKGEEGGGTDTRSEHNVREMWRKEKDDQENRR